MKKYYRNLVLSGLVIAFAVSGCEDDLDVAPRDAQTEEDILADPNNAIQLVNGVYNKQLDYNMYSFSWIGVTSITSDNADKGSSAGDTGSDKHKMDNLTFGANDISFQDIWQGRYQGINRANNAIFYLERFNIDATLKARLIAESRFLRASFYFDLVRCFGGVPLVTQMIDINDTEAIQQTVFIRKTKEETYAQIEADLIAAAEILPVQYPSAEVGRATKGAANAMLAKVYLYQQKWQQAYDAAGEVIFSGQYALLDDYAQVWREAGENGSESVYEVQATVGNGLVDYTNVQGPRGTPDLGWGFNIPSQSLVNAYEAGDERRDATIMFVPGVLWDGFIAPTTWSNPRYNYKAYQSSIAESWDGNKGNTAKNFRLLKYSDVLLIRAEAAFHIGNNSEATDRVNEIRDRANLGLLSSVTLEQILKERRLEMAMEHDRWFDLVRTGTAQAAMAADGKTFVPGVHEVFPIPANEITRSGGLLTPNPGY